MFLMKLRVFETPRQVAAFGWATVQRDVDSSRSGQGLLLSTVCASEGIEYAARVLCDLGQEGARVQRGTSSDQGGPATFEHRHPLRDNDEGVGRSVQFVP